MAGTDGTAAQLGTTRTILYALAGGVVLFAAVALYVGPVGNLKPMPIVMGLDPLVITAIVMTIGGVGMSYVLPGRIVDVAREASPAQRVSTFRASRIVAGALCEGPALFWGVLTLLTGERWCVAPMFVLAALIAMHAPTRESFESATGQRVPEA